MTTIKHFYSRINSKSLDKQQENAPGIPLSTSAPKTMTNGANSDTSGLHHGTSAQAASPAISETHNVLPSSLIKGGGSSTIGHSSGNTRRVISTLIGGGSGTGSQTSSRTDLPVHPSPASINIGPGQQQQTMPKGYFILTIHLKGIKPTPWIYKLILVFIS